jgi:hypothetical protein
MMFRHARVRTTSRSAWKGERDRQRAKSTTRGGRRRRPRRGRRRARDEARSVRRARRATLGRDPVRLRSSSSGSGSSSGARRPSHARAPARAASPASHGFRGSSGPWRYVPITRPARQPSKPLAPSLPKPCTTRPSGSAPLSSTVRPAWFLEPGERTAGPLAVEQDVADHAALPGDRVERQESGPGQLDAVAVAVVAPEQLIAAADREDAAPSATASWRASAFAARSTATRDCSRSCPPPT